jgi:hypothetical protein
VLIQPEYIVVSVLEADLRDSEKGTGCVRGPTVWYSAAVSALGEASQKPNELARSGQLQHPMLASEHSRPEKLPRFGQFLTNHSCDTPYVGTAETALAVASSATILLRQS